MERATLARRPAAPAPALYSRAGKLKQSAAGLAGDLPRYLRDFEADAALPTPLYHQIFLHFRNAIADGSLESGEALPSEMELAKHLGVSRITMRRALNELAGEALIRRRQGRGTVVAEGAVHTPVIRGSFETLLDSLKVMSEETSITLLEVTETIPSPAIAKALGLKSEQAVQKAIRLRATASGPFSYLISYVPLPIAHRYSSEDLASTPMLKLLDRAGVTITEAEQQFSAVGADPRMAAALGVEVATPLLKIERIMRDPAGKAVQVLQGHYRPDRFVYCVQEKAAAPSQPTRAKRV